MNDKCKCGREDCPSCMFPEPAPASCSYPNSESVKTLGQRVETLEQLCGTIISTLLVNRQLGTLTSADDAQLDEMILSWQRQLNSGFDEPSS